MERKVWTVGHSNRELEEFLEILRSHHVEAIADVRRFPGSRRYPQFGSDPLAEALAHIDVAYHHFPELGGRRTSDRANSPNTAWRVAAFRAYADYMLTEPFAVAFKQLETLTRQRRTALMCAEALPWRCHRRLLADRFLALGYEVFDVMGVGKARPHELPLFAKLDQDELTYPGDEHEPG
jgi:uncharacterized protein (DUF488 family)